MNFDFAALLLLLTVITGVIWGVDALWFAKRRAASAPPPSEAAADKGKDATGEQTEPAAAKEPILVEYSRFLFPVVLVVFIVRGFIAEPFQIPSGSMLPTLNIGDYILVNKFSYGLRMPVFHFKILDFGRPDRGDVVVFRFPHDPDTDFIKRVIGLPGDHIEYHDKTVFINGKRMEQNYVGHFRDERETVLKLEKLPDIAHSILIEQQKPALDGSWVVPEGSYFVMGDNRDNSNDSRYWGFVKDKYLKGRAFLVAFNWADDESPKWSRIGTIIH
jgi:signal peptidase I